MNIKILNYQLPKMMLTYPYNAFYFGILEANDIKYEDILLKEFLDVYYFKKCGIHKIDFNRSGTVEKGRFSVVEFENYENIIATINNKIDNGYYAIVMLNQKYFLNEKVHTDWEHNHDWLIYGYDDYNKVFYCSSYVQGVLDTIKLSYKEVEQAFLNVSQRYIKPSPSHFRNRFIKIDEKWVEETVREEEIFCNFKRLFNPYFFVRDGYWHPIVGLYSLKILMKKTNKKSTLKHKKKIFIQNMRIIYDFRQNILLLLKKLKVEKNKIQEYQKIINETYVILLLSYKYNKTKDEVTWTVINKKLKKTIEVERKMLKVIYKSYKKKRNE